MGFDEILERLASKSLTRRDIVKILDEIIASTHDRTLTKEDLEEVAGRAQALKERIVDYRGADVLSRESQEIMKKIAARPSRFSELWPQAISKARQAKELRRGIPEAYTLEQREFLLEFAKRLADKRR